MSADQTAIPPEHQHPFFEAHFIYDAPSSMWLSKACLLPVRIEVRFEQGHIAVLIFKFANPSPIGRMICHNGKLDWAAGWIIGWIDSRFPVTY